MAAETRRARLTLPASPSATASIVLEPRPKGKRTTRAVLILAATLVLTPVVFLVPPHFLWPLVVLALGLYFARREWVGEYVVASFEGACPRCGEALTLEPGARIRGRQRLECYGCHREPELVVGGEPPAVGSGDDGSATGGSSEAGSGAGGPDAGDPGVDAP